MAKLAIDSYRYADLDAYLGERSERKIGHNTVLHRPWPGTHIAVRLHSTDVLLFGADGCVEINTGGWNTPTTRDRINSFLFGSGYSLFTKNYQLFIQTREWKREFSDGMTLNLTGL